MNEHFVNGFLKTAAKKDTETAGDRILRTTGVGALTGAGALGALNALAAGVSGYKGAKFVNQLEKAKVLSPLGSALGLALVGGLGGALGGGVLGGGAGLGIGAGKELFRKKKN